MKREALICIIWIALMLTPMMTVNSPSSATNDLINHGIAYPVQVVWQFPDTAKGLIANKSTAIRVFVESTFTTRVWVEINVTYNFGTQWYLERGPYDDGIPIDPGYNRIYIPGGPAFPAFTENWRWRPSMDLFWTRTGWDDKIEVMLDPLNKVPETNETNNGCTFGAVEIVKSKQLKILVVPLSCDPSEWLMDLQANINFLRDTYPVARDSISWTMGERIAASLNAYSYPHADDLYRCWVRDLSTEARILGYDRVVAVIPGPGTNSITWSGIAVGMLKEPEDRVPVIVDATSLRDKVKLVAHEVGHTYYLWHPHDIGPPVYEATRYWVNMGEYEQVVNNSMSYRRPPHWIDNGRYDSDPKTWIDLSGYGTEVDGTWQWNLFDQFRAIEFRVPIVIVTGLISINGTIKLDRNWYRIPEGIPDLVPTVGAPQKGDYTIFMLNSSRQVLSQMSFNASFTYLADMDGTLVIEETDTVPFLFNAPYVEGTRFIQIQNATGQVLAERAVTANSPIVNVTFPNGGENLEIGTNYTITWEAYDPDEDELTYFVAYSPDGGETWIPLANNLNETHYVWDTYNLTSGDRYLIKVIATDGTNTGEDVSNSTFTFVDSTPPPSPVVSSLTHPNPETWYSSNNPTFQWTVPPDPSGIAGYSYILDDSSTTIPDETIDIAENSVVYSNLNDGTWYFHVRAMDNATNWGSSDHFHIKIDTAKPIISNTNQNPSSDSVRSNKNVTVRTNVTDVTSGVKEAALSYRYKTNNDATWSAWINMTMNLETVNAFVGSIPGFPVGAQVQYRIFALDNANNSAVDDNSEQYYVYTVIASAEFPWIIILPLFAMIMFVAFLIQRRRKAKGRS